MIRALNAPLLPAACDVGAGGGGDGAGRQSAGPWDGVEGRR